jgi:hypothetical protein
MEKINRAMPISGGDGWLKGKAVPLLEGAPPEVSESGHSDCHNRTLAEPAGKSNSYLTV